MATRTPRVERPDASPTSQPDLVVNRTRAVPGAPAGAPPTTAQLIHRTDASIERPLYAGLGMALHHFTEMLERTIDRFELHRATTMLTKQVCALLDDDDALEAIRRLVTDPDRVALPDGRRAAELCGDSWGDVRDVAMHRSIASCEGAQEFGRDAIVNLAVVRGVGAAVPWWGTPMWRRHVDLVPLGAISDDDRTRLLDEPELAGDDLLSLALHESPARTVPDTPGADGADARGQRRVRDTDVDATSPRARAVLTR